MATSVQILNISSSKRALRQKDTTPVVLKPAFRTAQGGDTLVGNAQAVDLAKLVPGAGLREFQKLLASGDLIVLPTTTLS